MIAATRSSDGKKSYLIKMITLSKGSSQIKNVEHGNASIFEMNA